MAKLNNPHDKYFKKTMRKKTNATSFFKEYLPEKITKKLDLRTLSIVKGAFISAELQERFSDIIYKVSSKEKTFFIFLLLEHQSSIDKWMHLRFLDYMKGFYALYLEQKQKIKKLPGIVPVLFYHGKQPWNESVHSWDIIESHEDFEEFIPKFDYVLLDFSPMSDLQIKGSIILQLFLRIMKKIRSSEFKEEFLQMIPLFVKLSAQKTGMEYLMTTLKYIFEVSDLKSIDIEKKLIPAIEKDKRGEIMTLAEQFEQRGEKRGEKRGEIKGAIKILQELLEKGLLAKEVVEVQINEYNKKLKQLVLSST